MYLNVAIGESHFVQVACSLFPSGLFCGGLGGSPWMHREAGCSLCGRTVFSPEWTCIGLYPPPRFYSNLHRDPSDHCWIAQCHGCTLHESLIGIEEDLQDAQERATTRQQVALQTWLREERRQVSLREAQEQRAELDAAEAFAGRRLARTLDEYQQRLNSLSGPQSGTVGGPDPAQAVQSDGAWQPAPAAPPAAVPPAQGDERTGFTFQDLPAGSAPAGSWTS